MSYLPAILTNNQKYGWQIGNQNHQNKNYEHELVELK